MVGRVGGGEVRWWGGLVWGGLVVGRVGGRER